MEAQMHQPDQPAPQKSPEDRRLESLQSAVDRTWQELAAATSHQAQKQHAHAKVIADRVRYTQEQIFAAAQDHRRAEDASRVALAACVKAQRDMYEEIDRQQALRNTGVNSSV